jgi:inhibitor of the pro-sigma K processing machinery
LLVVLFFALGLVLLYLTGWLLTAPLKVLLRLIISGLLGGAALLLVNVIGGIFSVTIAINPISALVAGYFGLPGIVLLLLIKIVIR